MTAVADTQAPLEAVLKDEILRMYQAVADQPESTFHFFHGREAAELFGYDAEWLDRAPAGAVASFAGVGNPHERSHLQPGETVLVVGIGGGVAANSALRSRLAGETAGGEDGFMRSFREKDARRAGQATGDADRFR